MNGLKLAWGTCLFLLLHSAIWAQSLVNGQVLEKAKTEDAFRPLPFATVYWENTKVGTTSVADGSFSIPKVEGSNRLIISFIGYHSDTIEVKGNQAIQVVLNSSVSDGREVLIEQRVKSTEMSMIDPIRVEQLSEKELFKAACCNLSESFETNPSVDVSFTDALSGRRQIKMLGLDGPYVLVSRENMPDIRGIGNGFGLGAVPGSWISSIQVTKGVGSVVNGYESIAGQINTELRKPEEEERLFVNFYINQAARTEANVISTQVINKNWGTTLLLHGSVRPMENDQNNDGFMDFPTSNHINIMNRWKYTGDNNWRSQFGFNYIKDDRTGGELGFDGEGADRRRLFGLNVKTNMIKTFAKIGYVFPATPYKSFGLQLSGMIHDQESYFGNNDYDAKQNFGYANFIYQSIIGNSDHTFRTGLSFIYDEYREDFRFVDYNRTEEVSGAFFEYTWKIGSRFTMVSGIRADHHNLFGTFVTPRLHARYAFSDQLVMRVLGGSGRRTANIFAENQSLFASSRNILIQGNASNLPFGMQQEQAWNYGLNLTKKFRLDYRDGYASFDFYRTEFVQQVVVDRDFSAREVRFYNLEGDSYSNSLQFELGYELIKFLDVRLAYRWLDVKTDYQSGTLRNPFVSEHRLFMNWAYEGRENLKEGKWIYDLTVQWIGAQRIPTTTENPAALQRETNSPDFLLLNAQVTRDINQKWSVYLGVENLGNYRQDDPIIDAANPDSEFFDASMVWGPIFGRMAYGGLRFRIQ